MTDEKVKESVAQLREMFSRWDARESNGVEIDGIINPDNEWGLVRALIADHDKLATSEAKLTALVEAGSCEGDDSGHILAFLNGLHAHLPEDERPTSWMQFSDEQRDRIKAAWRSMAQALAHHSAPVGEAAPGHTDLMVTPESIDAFMEVNPLTTEGSGTALHELTSRMMLTAHKLERGDLRALCNGGGSFDLVESAGFGGNANAFMASLLRQAISFLAPPTTPTSAPVEDVGGPRASGVSPTSAAIHALWFAEGIVSSSTWSDADKQATRDRFRQVEAELLRLSALIQPQGEERS